MSGPLGHIPPAEVEADGLSQLDRQAAMERDLNQTASAIPGALHLAAQRLLGAAVPSPYPIGSIFFKLLLPKWLHLMANFLHNCVK